MRTNPSHPTTRGADSPRRGPWLLLGLSLTTTVAMAQDPVVDPAKLRAIEQRFAAGEAKAALADLERLAAANPRAAEPQVLLARLCNIERDFERAELASRRAIRLAPRLADAYLERAFTLGMTDRGDLAAADFDKAIELAPDNARARGMRADHAAAQNDLEPARRDYEAALRCDAGYAAAHRGLGVVLHRQGDYQAAVQQFREAMRLQSAAPDLPFLVADSLWQCGQLDVAIREVAAVADGPAGGAFAFYRLGNLHSYAGDHSGAIAALRRVAELAPASSSRAGAHHRIGCEHLALGDVEAARAAFTIASKDQVWGPWAQLMAWASWMPGDPARAAQELPKKRPKDAFLQAAVDLARDGTGDRADLTHAGGGGPTSVLLYLSSLRADAAGRSAEAEVKLLRAVNVGAGDSVQSWLALDRLQRRRPQPLAVGFGCTVQAIDDTTLRLTDVVRYGAAEQQGLRVGDVITNINRGPATLAAWQGQPGHQQVALTTHLTLRRGEAAAPFALASGLLPAAEHLAFTPQKLGLPTSIDPSLQADAPAGWRPWADVHPDQPPTRTLWHRVGEHSEVYVGKLGGAPAQLFTSWRHMFALGPLDAASYDDLPHLPLLSGDGRWLELTGDYTAMTPEDSRANARMLVAAVSTADGTTFVRLLGPDAEVLAHRAEFLAFCATLRKAP